MTPKLGLNSQIMSSLIINGMGITLKTSVQVLNPNAKSACLSNLERNKAQITALSFGEKLK